MLRINFNGFRLLCIPFYIFLSNILLCKCQEFDWTTQKWEYLKSSWFSTLVGWKDCGNFHYSNDYQSNIQIFHYQGVTELNRKHRNGSISRFQWNKWSSIHAPVHIKLSMIKVTFFFIRQHIHTSYILCEIQYYFS